MSEQFDIRQAFSPTPHDDVPDWVNDYFRQINSYLHNLEQILVEPIHVEPYRKFDGMFIFADGTDFDPGFGRGVYYRDNLELGFEWQYLISADAALRLFPLIGYGGLRLATPTAIADLAATWITLPLDTGTITTPIGVTQDTANDGLIFEYEGVWSVALGVTLAHNEVNASRTAFVRLFNATDAIAGVETEIFVGRNQAGLNFAFSTLFEIPASSVGDLFVVQMRGDTDTFSTVSVESNAFSAHHVSQALSLTP